MISRKNDKKKGQLTQKRKKNFLTFVYILSQALPAPSLFHHNNINANKKNKNYVSSKKFPILFNEVVLDWLTKKAELVHQTYTTFLFILVVINSHWEDNMKPCLTQNTHTHTHKHYPYISRLFYWLKLLPHRLHFQLPFHVWRQI